MKISPPKKQALDTTSSLRGGRSKDSCQIMYVEANVELQCRENGVGEGKDCNAAADEQEMELL